MGFFGGKGRLWTVAVVAAGLWSLAILWHAPAALAANAYPYADVPCIWAPYDTAGAAVQWCNDYDWGYIRGDLSAASVISPYGYYYRNCTDYTAWMVSALGVGPGQYKGLGNAKEWAVRAPQHGLRVDNAPAVGSVAVRTTGKYGHTAFVESINPDSYPVGTIKVSQYNYHADGNYTEEYGTPAFFGFSVFVHFEDYETVAAPVVAAVEIVAPPEEVAAPDAAPSVEASVADSPAVDPVPVLITEASVDVPTAAEPEVLAAEVVQEEVPPPEDPPADVPPPVQTAPNTQQVIVAAIEPGQVQLPPAPQVSEETPVPVEHQQPVAASLVRHVTPDTPPPVEYWSLVGLTGAVLLKEAPPRLRNRQTSR